MAASSAGSVAVPRRPMRIGPAWSYRIQKVVIDLSPDPARIAGSAPAQQGRSASMAIDQYARHSTAGHSTRRPWDPIRTFALLGMLLLISAASGAANKADGNDRERTSAWKVDQWYIFTSLYTKHWDDDPEHVNHQKLLGVEAQMDNRWLFGLALFDNSFGQASQYLYGGYSWDLLGSELFHFKLTGGLLHGYEGRYQDKIPLNDLGIAPAILPTIGLQYKSFIAELNIAGTAAFTITAGFAF
jgi:hypothetical protein